MYAQDGTLLDGEAYQNEFLVQPGVPFEHDFSTPTRFKFFEASVQQSRAKATMTIEYINDVSTFNTIDFSNQMTLVSAQAKETMSGSYTFSTSLEPASGHYKVSYTLTCHR
jgi:hypothetical protein